MSRFYGSLCIVYVHRPGKWKPACSDPGGICPN